MKTIALIGLLIVLLPRSGLAAGTTVITHGLNGNADGWVSGMADRMSQYPRFPGSSTTYEITVSKTGSMIFTSWSRTAGAIPTSSDSGEILIRLDWGALAGLSIFGTEYDTGQVAPLVVSALTLTNFIPELQGHALAELPMHLIGHSRGGSLVSEVSRLLGNQGIWVDQVTTLDPHPLTFIGSDAPANCYENVLFQDNYFQDIGLIYGYSVPGSFNRKLTNLAGGYDSEHSDTHLWYHGTLDFRVPASDTELQGNLGFSEL